ncbi:MULTISPECIES: hypothetical protein [unclassified Mycoplasma]
MNLKLKKWELLILIISLIVIFAIMFVLTTWKMKVKQELKIINFDERQNIIQFQNLTNHEFDFNQTINLKINNKLWKAKILWIQPVDLNLFEAKISFTEDVNFTKIVKACIEITEETKKYWEVIFSK